VLKFAADGSIEISLNHLPTTLRSEPILAIGDFLGKAFSIGKEIRSDEKDAIIL
jgi:hypothetical protein